MSSVPGDRWYRLSPEIEQPKKYQPESSTMNRQVIPSMILSVLIVCSFAIALFERDPDAAGRKADPGPAAKTSTPPSASPSPGLANASASAARLAEPATAGARTPGQETSVTTEPPPQANGLRERGSDPAPAPVPSVAPGANAPRPEETGAGRPSTATEPAAGASSAAPPSTAPASTVPRAAYTVVQKGETLKDVAVRVYGSSDGLDSFWRANRDVLPRSDSPLSAGAVLRTPGE
jgi:hypothetical protein